MNVAMFCLFVSMLMAGALATSVASGHNPVASAASVHNGLRYEYGIRNAHQSAAVSGGSDLDVSASNMPQSYSGNSFGSIIGNKVGGAVGDILRRILKSLAGIGFRLGINLNNELYSVPDYSGEQRQMYGGNDKYANGYSQVQEAVLEPQTSTAYGDYVAHNNQRDYYSS